MTRRGLAAALLALIPGVPRPVQAKPVRVRFDPSCADEARFQINRRVRLSAVSPDVLTRSLQELQARQTADMVEAIKRTQVEIAALRAEIAAGAVAKVVV
jgi:hypothetical protein